MHISAIATLSFLREAHGAACLGVRVRDQAKSVRHFKSKLHTPCLDANVYMPIRLKTVGDSEIHGQNHLLRWFHFVVTGLQLLPA